jgi:hypothetical protein
MAGVRSAAPITEREREIVHLRNAMAKSGARTRAHLVALLLSDRP